MKIKGAIFDCDGTLVDSLIFWETFYDKIGERFLEGEKFYPEKSDDRIMRTQPVGYCSKLLHEKYGLGKDASEIADWIVELFIWFYREVVELKAGVREFLEYLKSKDVRICIATAAETHLIEMVLDKNGVLDYFEKIISCSEVGAGKDKPDVFFAAEQYLGTPHDETWVFEDSVLAIETSKKAGFSVVGVYDKYTFGQDRARSLSDEYIDDGESFEKLIGKIE